MDNRAWLCGHCQDSRRGGLNRFHAPQQHVSGLNPRAILRPQKSSIEQTVCQHPSDKKQAKLVEPPVWILLSTPRRLAIRSQLR